MSAVLAVETEHQARRARGLTDEEYRKVLEEARWALRLTDPRSYGSWYCKGDAKEAMNILNMAINQNMRLAQVRWHKFDGRITGGYWLAVLTFKRVHNKLWQKGVLKART
jgi:hypothetical protein